MFYSKSHGFQLFIKKNIQGFNRNGFGNPTVGDTPSYTIEWIELLLLFNASQKPHWSHGQGLVISSQNNIDSLTNDCGNLSRKCCLRWTNNAWLVLRIIYSSTWAHNLTCIHNMSIFPSNVLIKHTNTIQRVLYFTVLIMCWKNHRIRALFIFHCSRIMLNPLDLSAIVFVMN